MNKFFINESIKINCHILNLKSRLDYNDLIKEFILKLELPTKLLVFFGSIFFILFYFIFLFFLPKDIQFKILHNIPLINKILHFYRKIILITYYEEK